jgi:hypothetical protein
MYDDKCSWLITGVVTRVIRRVPLVEQELLTLPDHLRSPPVFNGLRVARPLGLSVMLCRSLFVHLSFFCWPLCCPSLFDLQILVAPLVSSNSSYVTIFVSTNYVSQGITFVSYDQSQKIWKNSLHWKALWEFYFLNILSFPCFKKELSTVFVARDDFSSEYNMWNIICQNVICL